MFRPQKELWARQSLQLHVEQNKTIFSASTKDVKNSETHLILALKLN